MDANENSYSFLVMPLNLLFGGGLVVNLEVLDTNDFDFHACVRVQTHVAEPDVPRDLIRDN